MHRNFTKKFIASVLSSALILSAVSVPTNFMGFSDLSVNVVSDAADVITIDDLPSEYKYAADWIWENRIEREQSTVRRNTIFDQIVAGKGTINYVVKWQSYRQVTYEERQKFEIMLSDCINGWNDWLKGYENWPYEYIDVKIVGWAVIDESCLLDLHDDEIVYTDTIPYDSTYDTTNGREEIPDKEPLAPSELSRFDHFYDANYEYPGGLEKRFDMYMWATQGFPDIGGCGGDWGQRLSDTAYLAMIDGSNLHVLEHEIGHGFGMTDFYGGEGETDGFPPGGFPGGENSLMMAGSASKITDFDGWMLRYMWTKIKDEEGRFDLENAQPVSTETTTTTTTTTTDATTINTTAFSTDTTTTTIVTSDLPVTEIYDSFTDTIENVEIFSEDNWYFQNGYVGAVQFENNGYYLLSADYSTEDNTNLSYYENGDVVSIDFMYSDVPDADSELFAINQIYKLELLQNIRETETTTQPDNFVLGDANDDGFVNIADATAIIQFIANNDKYRLSEQGYKNADCYNPGDGVTGLDAYAIQLLETNSIIDLPLIEN